MSLPIHQRHTPEFHGVFERTARETIATMNELGRDVANQRATQPLALQKMGVIRTSVPVGISDPFGGSAPVQLACTVDLSVGVPQDRRGIHVSRIGDVLARLTTRAYSSLVDYATHLAQELETTQHAPEAHVRVEGDLVYLEENQGVKTKQSLEALGLFASVDRVGGTSTLSQGLAFSHITACPCVQETYRQSHSEASAGFLRDVDGRQMPFMTHSQRCRTRLSLIGIKAPLDTLALLNRIDKIVVRTRNTMPRELELMTVYQAHARPQFLEDVLRDLTFALSGDLASESPQSRIHIHSVSMESIHDFDLHGEIDFTLDELRRALHR